MSFNQNSKYLNSISVEGKKYKLFDLNIAAKDLGFDLTSMPYSIRILLENILRYGGSEKLLKSFSHWGTPNFDQATEVNFMPARVLMQDFTGVPAVVDLAAMRDAMKKLGGDPKKVNPLIAVDLVIDHSVQVDFAGSPDAFEKNTKLEFERNKERYQFLKWGQTAFQNFRVVPPGTGICHQVNLEYLAQLVWTASFKGEEYAYPDTLVGTDSHTTMINGLGVLGWGVGGIEAEAAMLGQALPMLIPEVIGVNLTGKLKEGITATDLVLTITEALRKKGVVGKFVEYFGPGLDSLTLADRATIANMAPEYGATCGFFPVDDVTIEYMNLTARSQHRIELAKLYSIHQKLWCNHQDQIKYTNQLTIDLCAIMPSIAGPKRPQDRVELANVPASIEQEIRAFEKNPENYSKRYNYANSNSIGHGDVVIAAITSCTNTSNPYVLVAAGLVAKKAIALGLTTKPWVKASLAPGSQVVTEYLNSSGLMEYLAQLKFNLVGYGCTTCIGNSGPLEKPIEEAITNNKLMVASVLSGNRNFEGRTHPLVRANYLASPPLVVAYALAGTTKINLMTDPISKDRNGRDVFLQDLWPTNEEVNEIVAANVGRKLFEEKYSRVFDGDRLWQAISLSEGTNYHWDDASTYIKNPPYFNNFSLHNKPLHDITSARILAIFGDSVTTDHISPAGNIAQNSPAANYLNAKNVENKDFNSYGARRGNHEVMMRGTFANIRIKNKMLDGVEGGFTKYFKASDGSAGNEKLPIYDAAMKYIASNTPLIIFAGKEYGTGSSRDWAAKGTSLLGVKVVIAESFERIHRSNLVGMGVVPCILPKNTTVGSLALTGDEVVNIIGINDAIMPMQKVECEIVRGNKLVKKIELQMMIMTENEIEYIKHGSILHNVVKQLYSIDQ